jgi:hypothetical protein
MAAGESEAHLQRWLDAGYQGEMDYGRPAANART